MKRLYYPALAFVILISASAFLLDHKNQPKQPADNFIIDTLASGLIVPWEIIFLPDRTMMFTERSGRVRLYRDKKLLTKPVLVLQETDLTKKMGLLGLCLHPEFIKNKFVYLSYNYRKENVALLRVVRYSFDNDSLINPLIIIDNISGSQNHTGCRLKFGPDKKLYLTTGDADRPALAQDLKFLNGKILRLNDDGTIPQDNPFVHNDTARKEVWTYGHRNPQGIDFQPGSGNLFDSEHGPTGGDEINRIERGKNYGWPVIHHSDSLAGMISPLIQYTPSIGPSALLFYTGNAFAGLKGSMLVACLRGESIIRFSFNKGVLQEEEVMLKQQYGRIRALTQGPDGFIYFSTSQNDPPEGTPRPGYDMILRLRPPAGYISAAPMKALPKKDAVKSIPVTNSPSQTFQQLCASCHGEKLQGSDKVKSMLDGKWVHGSRKQDIIKVITEGVVEKGMPAWEGAVSKSDISKLADFILSKTR